MKKVKSDTEYKNVKICCCSTRYEIEERDIEVAIVKYVSTSTIMGYRYFWECQECLAINYICDDLARAQKDRILKAWGQ